VETPDGFEVIPDQINNILVQISLVDLFDGVDFNQAKVDDDGVIRFNKGSNRDLADIVESNLEAASEMGLDEDEDGRIDNESIFSK
jgi:hypothetical protein